MAFRDGRKTKTFKHNKVGKVYEYKFYDDTLAENEINFTYKEHDGIDVTIEEIWGDMHVTDSSGISIEVYSQYQFKPKDVWVDINGNEYKVVNVKLLPHDNPWVMNKKDNIRFRKQYIFAG